MNKTVLAAASALVIVLGAESTGSAMDRPHQETDIKASVSDKKGHPHKKDRAYDLADSVKAHRMNFDEAKKIMPKIFKKLDNPKTIYCGCRIDFRNGWYYPDLKSCGYHIYSDTTRAERIEAEHIMPAYEFGSVRDCWKNGRNNCKVNDREFALMEGDLHNLYPAVGEVNGLRSNYKFSLEVKNRKNYFGSCQMHIDSKRQRAEPPERARGIAARAYLYMSQRYSLKLDDEHINLFNRWNREYAPDSNECLWNELVEKVQGNDNPFITKKCRKNK